MMAAEEKKPPKSGRAMSSETQEEELLKRIDRLENTLETLMKAITDDDYRESWEKKKKKRMKAVVMGTPQQALRARVGNAAKASGIDYHDWVERYGMRDKMLTHAERVELAGDPRQVPLGLQIEAPPKRGRGRPKGSKDKQPRKKYTRKK